ncbi:hypothetical protein [Alteromonas gilva]|uniref:Microcin J25-processing protein McjB C-terminal domain-containing protein n=1 Tax=Alteromonas gilva TaxID=2987522 RepID=A0ABT5L7Q0_9ALTE|nr:hypothetical protein [Alteromonas gilva]MDC8832907.1 hypothetical protein [Alteromonas gilva]
MLATWKKNLGEIPISNPQEYKAKKAFTYVLSWVHENGYKGACHDISAVLYLVLSELGYDCEIKIGEIQLETGAVTDHSWVQSNQLVTDIAISLPNYPGHIHSPIFQGVALDNNSEITCKYGIAYEGLSQEGKFVLGATLIEYCNDHPNGVDFVFKLASRTLKEAGVRVSALKLKNDYSHIKRVLVQ